MKSANVNVAPVTGGESYTNLSADGAVFAGEGRLLGMFCASSSGATVKLYDSLAASGTVLVNTFTAIAGTWYPLPFRCTIGCYMDITGTGDVTFAYS